MLFSTILALHITGAIITGIAIAFAVIALIRNTQSQYRICATVIARLAVFEILSGVALSVLSSKITAISLCSNIIAYLSTIAIAETLLVLRMKKVSIAYPIVRIASPVVASLVAFGIALAYGV